MCSQVDQMKKYKVSMNEHNIDLYIIVEHGPFHSNRKSKSPRFRSIKGTHFAIVGYFPQTCLGFIQQVGSPQSPFSVLTIRNIVKDDRDFDVGNGTPFQFI